MRNRHQKATSSMASLRHCRRLSINQSLLVESIDAYPHSAPAAGRFTHQSYPPRKSPDRQTSFADLVNSRAGLAEKLDHLLQERTMRSPERPASDQAGLLAHDQAAMADESNDERAASEASDIREDDQVEEASEHDVGERVTSGPPEAMEPQGHYQPVLPPVGSVWNQSQAFRPPNLPPLQQVTEAPYGRPLLQYSLSQTQPHIRRDNYADHYPTQGFYQPPAFYPGYQQVPLFSYGSGFAANEWTPLSGLDPFIAPTSRTTGSGSVEQHPFPTLSPVRPSMNLRQTGGQQYNSTQYGARHQETSLPPAESSSSCQGSFESSTDTLSSEHDSRQTNQCSHRQAQHAFSHPHPAYAGPYGSFGQYPATYPPPPGFYSYPSSTPQQWGYGSATQHLTGDRVGHSAHYVQEPFNPGTSAYTSSARRSDQAATRSSNQDDLQARDDEEFKHESPRPSHSVVRDLPRSRKCTRRPRPSESSRATSRRSTRSTRSKKKPAKYARRSPPGTPHTVDPAVSEMVERFQQQQPHVREKKRAATIARGTWSTREEAFAIELMKVTKGPRYRGTIEDLWRIISQGMQAEGMDRSAAAVKNQWNRSLRWKSGFDERARKKPYAMRTGANNYPEPKYRQAERRRRLTPSSSGTESELGRYTPVECDELDDDEKMEQKSVPDDETDTPERQELTANGASADTTAGAASATALNGPSNAATIRARGSDERANEAHESDDDDGMDETDQCQHNSSIHG